MDRLIDGADGAIYIQSVKDYLNRLHVIEQ